MTKIVDERKMAFIAGDFNIELIRENKAKSDLLSLMKSFNFTPSICSNTRATDTTTSCIDNIFTNSDWVESLVFENHVSDHMAQKVIFELSKTKKKRMTFWAIWATRIG